MLTKISVFEVSSDQDHVEKYCPRDVPLESFKPRNNPIQYII